VPVILREDAAATVNPSSHARAISRRLPSCTRRLLSYAHSPTSAHSPLHRRISCPRPTCPPPPCRCPPCRRCIMPLASRRHLPSPLACRHPCQQSSWLSRLSGPPSLSGRPPSLSGPPPSHPLPTPRHWLHAIPLHTARNAMKRLARPSTTSLSRRQDPLCHARTCSATRSRHRPSY